MIVASPATNLHLVGVQRRSGPERIWFSFSVAFSKDVYAKNQSPSRR